MRSNPLQARRPDFFSRLMASVFPRETKRAISAKLLPQEKAFITGIYETDFQSVGGGSSLDLINYTVPSGTIFSITHLGVFVRDRSAIGNLRWALILNGTPIPPYSSINELIGVEGVPEPVYINTLFYGGDVVSIRVTNNVPGIAFESGAIIRGRLS